MTAKEYSQQYIDGIKDIKSKVDQMAKLRELVTSTTTQLHADKVQSIDRSMQEAAKHLLVENICYIHIRNVEGGRYRIRPVGVALGFTADI